MPYSISTEAKDCNGFAVIKDNDGFIMGCHETEQEAQDQITALNISEAEAKGERQANPEQDIYETKEEAEAKAEQIGCVGSHTHEIDGKTYYMPCDKMSDYEEITGMKHKDEDDTTLVSYNSEQRAVDRTPPKFMQENAQRGLDNLNKAGDGLVDETVRQARIMARGEQLSIAKIRKIAPWHKRHLSDLDREKSNPNDPDTWRGSDVAFLLWGSNPWTDPLEAADWAERKVAQLINEGELEPRQSDSSTPAPKKDQIKGSKKNKPGSAKGKKGGITFSEATTKSIQTIVNEHNDEVSNMASWRRLGMGTAKSVVRRGFGAYSTSHRPGVSRNAWGLARLRAFSYLLKNDRPKNSKYITDNDLLPKEHPRYTKKENKSQEQHIEVFDRVVAISQTIELQKNNTNLKEMDRLTENRSFTFAAVEERQDQDSDTLLFTGYASVFDKPYGVRDSRGAYNETIKPGAFKKTLQEQDDVRFLVNHDGIPLARTSSGTLNLEEDEYGLFVRAELDPSNPTVAEVASAMKRGDLNEMSFAFAAMRDDFNQNGDERTVSEARLYDVSVVTYPANPWAGAKLRGLDIEDLHRSLVEARSGEQAAEVLEDFINKVEDNDGVDKKRSNAQVELLKLKLERDGIR
jgi:HK97 family phage prohead protease